MGTSQTTYVLNGGPTASAITVVSDATGKIDGNAAYHDAEGCTEGRWSGMIIDELPASPLRQFNLDLQGDGNTEYYQDSVPHPHGPDDNGEWNVLNIQALTGANSAVSTNPGITMSDNTGDATDPVSFNVIGDVAAWTGAEGANTLYADYLLLHTSPGFAIPSSCDFELTGLESGADYMLTFLTSSSFSADRGYDVIADLDGDGLLDDETATSIKTYTGEESIFFTANSLGELIGKFTIDDTDHTEGDISGFRLYQLTEGVSPEPIPGDTDGNKIVNELDAQVLATNWGGDVGEGGFAAGDFNDDGIVNVLDAAILAANWGDHTGGESVGVVPEPSMMLMLLAMLVAVVSRRSR
jgi:hypothetical protein